MYYESPVSLNFCVLSLFLVNSVQEVCVNLDLPCTAGCLKYISGMNLSPANKNLFTISFNI